jgi:serine/threonine protein phosphatase PrpC
MAMVHYDITGMSRAGRLSRNEDAYAVTETADACLLAVADGVGGEADGDRAAQIAIETVTSFFTSMYRTGMDGSAVRGLLESAFFGADRQIRAAAVRPARMGTTLVAAIVREHQVWIANCGDSRAFVAGKEVLFKTWEHSLVSTLVRMGCLDPTAVQDHPLKHVITHALGLTPCVDLYDVTIPAGTALVLCSDGLRDDVVREILAKEEIIGSETFARALVEGGAATSDDDVTVVVLKA